jgi:spermidine/putrescine transport system substrate-binding protein
MSDLDKLRLGQRPLSRRTMLRGVAGLSAAAGLGAIAAACGSSAAASVAPSTAPATAVPSVAPSTAPSEAASLAPSASAASLAPTQPPEPSASPEAELYIYNWADYIGEKTVADFEDKYGVKVTYDNFPDSDTQTAKISTGKSGYDLTFATSTNIKGYVARKLVQPLDLSLIPNLVNLSPEWQNPSYDPGNAHSVPYFWWTTGVAYLTNKVNATLTSWDAMWDPQWKGHMAMLDDYRECFSAALFKLDFDINTTDESQLDQALALLQQQKPLLRTYTTDDIQALSTGDAWLMHAWGADVHQVRTDNPDAKVAYYLPSEGAVRGSDAMVLLAGAQNPIAAQLFINYMLKPQVSANNTNFTGYMGPNQAALPYIDPAIVSDPGVNPGPDLIAKLQEIQDLGDKETLYTTRWTKLRAGA